MIDRSAQDEGENVLEAQEGKVAIGSAAGVQGLETQAERGDGGV